MSTHTSDPIGTPAHHTTRWRIDPTRSSVEFRVKNFWGMATVKGRFSRYHGTLDGERLHVQGRLHACGSSIPLELDATLRRVGDDLEVAAATEADHRRLGMTWNQMRSIAPRSRLRVTGRLVRDPD